MDFITTIFNSPLPVALSAIIAILACAGYWFFVIPMLEEVKTLRTRNNELQDMLQGEFKRHLEQNLVKLNNMASTFDNISHKEILTALIELKEMLAEHNTNALHKVETNVSAIFKVLARMETKMKTKPTAELTEITKMLNTILAEVDDIGDKQSQVTGILTGMSLAQSLNKRL